MEFTEVVKEVMATGIQRSVIRVLVAEIREEFWQPSDHVSLVVKNVDLILFIGLARHVERVMVDCKDVGAVRIVLVIKKIPLLAIVATENAPLACGISEHVVIYTVVIKLDHARRERMEGRIEIAYE